MIAFGKKNRAIKRIRSRLGSLICIVGKFRKRKLDQSICVNSREKAFISFWEVRYKEN